MGKAHLFRFLYAGLQYHIDIRSQLGAAKNLDEIREVAATLAERRTADYLTRGGQPDPARPDRGWYLRYRRPLGDRSGEKQSRAERKAAALGQTSTEDPRTSVADDNDKASGCPSKEKE